MDTLERQTPAWLETGDAGFSVANILSPPLREYIDEPIQEQLIVVALLEVAPSPCNR